MADKAFRLTYPRMSVEASFLLIALLNTGRTITWGFRRWIRPFAYHPIAVLIISVYAWALSVHLIFMLALFAIHYVAIGTWMIRWPDSYRKHADPRIKGFFAGQRIRWRPRRKLTSLGLLDAKDPVPPISRVRRIGCVTRVWIKMSAGDEIAWWQVRSKRIAQTYNAGACKVIGYKRGNFLSLRISGLSGISLRPPFINWKLIKIYFAEKIPKYQWLELELLTKDPFLKPVGAEYIQFHRTGELLPAAGNPVGPKLDGSPYKLKVATHLLVITISGGGKSTAERTMVYTDYQDVMARLVENWGFDGKRGTELSFMEHCFAHHCYADGGPQEVLQFFKDLDTVVDQRLVGMRYEDVQHTPTTHSRRIDCYIDEFLIFEQPAYAQVRKEIYAYIWDIQLRGRAAGVRLKAFAQNPAKDNFPLRDDFNEVQVGAVRSRTQVEMAMPGSWERGANAEDIEIPGVFFVQAQNRKDPEQIRYAQITNEDIRALPQCPPSIHKPAHAKAEATTARWGGFDGRPPSNGNSTNGHKPSQNGHKPKNGRRPQPAGTNGQHPPSSNGHKPEPQPAPTAPEPEPTPTHHAAHPRFGGFDT